MTGGHSCSIRGVLVKPRAPSPGFSSVWVSARLFWIIAQPQTHSKHQPRKALLTYSAEPFGKVSLEELAKTEGTAGRRWTSLEGLELSNRLPACLGCGTDRPGDNHPHQFFDPSPGPRPEGPERLLSPHCHTDGTTGFS